MAAHEGSGADWYEMQSTRDSQAAERSPRILGREGDVFVDAMALVYEMLKSVFAEGEIHDLPSKMKIGVANHAFNLLWSAWQNAMAGRNDACVDHWRSIDESPEFLAALQVNPRLARPMMDGKLKYKTALRTVIRERNRLQTGDGDRWAEEQKWRQVRHRFAHVDPVATMAALPIALEGSDASALVEPGGGVVEPRGLRRMCLYLAEAAVSLIWWVNFAFQDTSKVSEIWETKGREYNLRAHSILKVCGAEIGVRAK